LQKGREKEGWEFATKQETNREFPTHHTLKPRYCHAIKIRMFLSNNIGESCFRFGNMFV
jgi:hypothetical protein